MIRPRTPRGEQLGEFLTSRRRLQSRAALGLPPGNRRSETGLSREEVATLAGMSVSWYTWLEQGRDINPSRGVLEAVARVLQLSDTEADYLYALAGPSRPASTTQPTSAPEHLLRLVRALPFPAFILTPDWSIVGWNAGYEWLYGPILTIPKEQRNLLRIIYTDPHNRDLLPNWDRDSRSFLAEFRAESGVRLASEEHRALIASLSELSSDFRTHWAEQTVGRFQSRLRTFQHPDAGRIVFEHHRQVPSDAGDLHLVMYVPVDHGSGGGAGAMSEPEHRRAGE